MCRRHHHSSPITAGPRPSHRPLVPQSSNVAPMKATSSQVSHAHQWLGDHRKHLPGLVTPSNGGASIGSDGSKTKRLGNSVFFSNPQLLPGQSKLFKAKSTPYQSSDGVQSKGSAVSQNESQASQTAKYLPIYVFFIFSSILRFSGWMES